MKEGRQRYERWTAEVRAEALKRLEGAQNISALAKELGITRSLLYSWRHVQQGRGWSGRAQEEPRANAQEQRIEKLEKQVQQLKAALGEKTLETDFFRSALRRVNQNPRKAGDNGEPNSTGRSKTE